jgi:Tetratricopeptide repeat
MSLNNQSERYADAGEPSKGIAPIEEAVQHYKFLSDSNPTRFLPDLAQALNNQSNRYAQVGNPIESLAPIEEAVLIRQALAEADPARFLPDLAQSLNNQSIHYAGAGYSSDGVAPIDEAVHHYRTLAEAEPTRFLPYLAQSLSNQSARYAEIGLSHEAAAFVDEAVEICWTLAEGDPIRFLPDLAAMLDNQSSRYAAIGQSDEALAAIDDAVHIRRALIKSAAIRVLPDLATSLNNQSNRYAEVGQLNKALAAITEAVQINRGLAESEPARFRPYLAISLDNLSNRYAEAGQPDKALAAITEAVHIQHSLADANPTRFLPELVRSLRILARRLTQAGRREEAGHVFDDLLDQWRPASWPRAVLLLGRAEHLADSNQQAAAEDALAAARLAEEAGDRDRRGRARQLLRQLQDTHPAAVATTWTSTSAGLPPVWLRITQDDPHTTQLIMDWINSAGWTESFNFLADEAGVLLTDGAEATLEHLIDANPHATELDQHLDLLRAARTDGIDTVHAEFLGQQASQHQAAVLQAWIATESWPESADYLTEHTDDLLTDSAEQLLTQSVGDQPQLLLYLGLLALARDLSVATAHAYITDPATLNGALQAATGHRLLHLAQLNAGLHPDAAPAHLRHALAATALSAADEAAWAAHRCRDVSASWERPSLITQAKTFAAEHPDLDLTPVMDAISQTDPAPDPAPGG